MTALRLISRTKLYWGLMLIFLIGVVTSPVSSKGSNIFLSYGNLLDVLRQVSITGLVATGMTAVILTAGIDLSVGSIMAICTVVCAMLLTIPGPTPAAAMGIPAFAVVAFVVCAAVARFVFVEVKRTGDGGARRRADIVLDRMQGAILPVLVGAAGLALALWFVLRGSACSVCCS
jgi:simple sugar transport system permease protein